MLSFKRWFLVYIRFSWRWRPAEPCKTRSSAAGLADASFRLNKKPLS